MPSIKLDIKKKLFAGFGAGLMILVIVSLVAFKGTGDLVSNQGDVNHTHEVLESLDQIVLALVNSETGQRGYLVTGEDRYLEPYTNGIAAIYGHIDHLAELTSDNPAQQERIATLRHLVDEKLAELKDTIELRQGSFEAALAVVLTDAGKDVADKIRVLIDEMIAEEQGLLVVRAASTSSSAKLVNLTIIGGLITGFIVTTVVSLVLASTIAGGVSKISQAMKRISVGELGERVEITSSDEIGEMSRSYKEMQTYLQSFAHTSEQLAAGDLTVEAQVLSTQDVLGNAFKTMITNFNELLSQVTGTAQQLVSSRDQLAQSADDAASATQEIAQVSSQVAEGISQQAKGTQEVNTAIEQLSKVIESNVEGAQTRSRQIETATSVSEKVSSAAVTTSENAQQAAYGARRSAEASQNGADMVQKTIEGMDRIKETVEVASEEISKLGKQSAEIGKIVSVIDDIAAQTNLLALNAAIEAAPAGEQGRGFAVVADEVRTLAERVVNATKEIADLIAGVQAGVDGSVKAIEEGSTEMETGTGLAAEAATALQEILSVVQENLAAGEEMRSNVKAVNESIGEIASISEENSTATEEVCAAAQQMSAQVEEVTAATHSMGESADSLQLVVGKFKLRNSGSEPSTIAIPKAADTEEDVAA